MANGNNQPSRFIQINPARWVRRDEIYSIHKKGEPYDDSIGTCYIKGGGEYYISNKIWSSIELLMDELNS